jgi:hypothetical protein
MKRSMGLLVAAMLVAGSVSAAAPAFAGDDDVRRSGGCSGNSTWKLKLSEEDGGIEVEYEVDQNVNGDKWRVKLFRNGKRFFRGIRTTKGPSGSFEVERVTANGGGPDHFRARARNRSTDELCKGRATW